MDPFESAAILDASGARRDVRWLRQRYGAGPRLVLAPGWELVLVWEQSGPMTAGVALLSENDAPLVDYPVIIGWPGTAIQTKTRLQRQLERDVGWIDVPIAGGEYDPTTGGSGPMYIAADDGSWRYEGIGWRIGTNHDHLNIVLRKRAAGAAPAQPPAPGPSPVPSPPSSPSPARPDPQVLDALRSARDAIQRAIVLLGGLP